MRPIIPGCVETTGMQKKRSFCDHKMDDMVAWLPDGVRLRIPRGCDESQRVAFGYCVNGSSNNCCSNLKTRIGTKCQRIRTGRWRTRYKEKKNDENVKLKNVYHELFCHEKSLTVIFRVSGWWISCKKNLTCSCVAFHRVFDVDGIVVSHLGFEEVANYYYYWQNSWSCRASSLLVMQPSAANEIKALKKWRESECKGCVSEVGNWFWGLRVGVGTEKIRIERFCVGVWALSWDCVWWGFQSVLFLCWTLSFPVDHAQVILTQCMCLSVCLCFCAFHPFLPHR